MVESVDYQAVLADLKGRRVRLDQLIAGIEAVIMGQTDAAMPSDADDLNGAGAPLGPVAVTIHPDTFFGLSIIDATRKYLKMARRAQHLKAIADALAQGGLKRPSDNVMSGILVRAAKGRELIKVGKGMWGLSEWYPKPPRAEPTEDRRKRPASRKTARGSKKNASPKNAAPKALPAPRATQEAAAHTRPSDVALEVMREAGKPLHAVEITKRVNDRGVVASRLPIESFLNRQTKAGKMKKVGPSTFALAG